MKKILIATPLYPPEIGGPATYVHELEKGLEDFDIKVVKFSSVRRLPKGIRHALYFLYVLFGAIGKDAIFALDPVSVGLPAMYAAKILRKPFFLKIVGDYAWEQGKQRIDYFEYVNLDTFVKLTENDLPKEILRLRNIQEKVIHSAKKLIVPSNYLRSILIARSIPEEKINVIYNAVSMDGVGDIPQGFKLPSRPRVVSVGRMVPWKEFDGVIDAVKETDASLIIVGEGPQHEYIGNRARRKLDGRVLFTGALSHMETLAIIKDADIFVLNSSYEGFSHTLLEALLLGKAVIATDAGGNREMVNGKNGFLIPVGDTNILVRKLQILLSDRNLKESFEREAKNMRQVFSRERMLKETDEFLKKNI